MKTKNTILAILFLVASPFSLKNLEAANYPELPTVSQVELSRYLGKWHEIVRLPNSFQKNCHSATATYSLRDDGDIRVINECIRPNGKTKTAKGKAWVTDTETNAKLKVQFFWPFSGDYWILSLDEDYQTVMVGEPSRKYLWVLNRSPELEESKLNELKALATNLGFDVSQLIDSKAQN